MERSRQHCDELTRSDHDLSILELDGQLSIDPNKGFIGIRMPVPPKLFSHHA